MREPSANVVVAILAAGKSTRMGGKPKLCLPWPCNDFQRELLGEDFSGTILSHLICEWQQLGAAEILLVPGGVADAAMLEIERMAVRADERETIAHLFRGWSASATHFPDRDMMGSVQTAAAVVLQKTEMLPILPASASPSHLIISLGDQPHLQALTLQLVINATQDPANARSILRPRRNGRGGHPLAIPQHLIAELSTTELSTLKHFLQLHVADIVDVPCEDPGLVHDVDTPADYEAARRMASAQIPG